MANNKRLTALTVRHLNVTDNIRIRGTLFANATLTAVHELVYPSAPGVPGISMEGSSIIKIKASDIEVLPFSTSTTPPLLHGTFDISCNDISCNVFDAATFNFTDISGSRAYFTDISGVRAQFTDISGSTAYFTDISGVRAQFTDISGSSAYFTDISGSRAYFNDISGSRAYFTDISGVRAYFNDISGSRAYFTDISGVRAYFTDISGSTAYFTDISGVRAQFTDISGSRAYFTDISGVRAQFTDISGSRAYFTDISGVRAQFTDISGSTAYFTDISGVRAQFTDISGSTAYFTDLSCNMLSASADIVSNTSSDIRFKTNVNKIENPLEKISKINGYTYDWIQSNLHPYNGKDTGIIAQEVETMDLPGIVVTRSNGYKGVKYERLIPLLLESIKSLQETDVKQQEQINRLMEK
jgi:uncharacterized protein YjbI with pentapeptide repeats